MQLRRDKIGFVFQQFYLIPGLSVFDNIALPLLFSKKSAQQSKIRELAEMVGLQHRLNHAPAQLSGGMQQRVGLARGLAVDPEVLLMDEAFSALDPLIRTEMQDELLKLQEQDQRTVVFISHDLAVVRQLSDRILVLHHGRLVEQAATGELFERPKEDYTQRLLAAVPGRSLSPR